MEVKKKIGESRGEKALSSLSLSLKVIQQCVLIPHHLFLHEALYLLFHLVWRQVNLIFLSPFYSKKRLKDLPQVTRELWV